MCVVHVSRARAVLRSALLRFASRTALGTYLLGFRAKERAGACRVPVPRSHCGAARSQCVYCGACGTFSRVGLARVGVPWQRPAKSRTPTQRVDTSPPRGDHIHHHTTSLSSTDPPVRRSTEDPGAPLLSVVCASTSSQQPPGCGAAKIRKLRGYPTGWKQLAANAETTQSINQSFTHSFIHSFRKCAVSRETDHHSTWRARKHMYVKPPLKPCRGHSGGTSPSGRGKVSNVAQMMFKMADLFASIGRRNHPPSSCRTKFGHWQGRQTAALRLSTKMPGTPCCEWQAARRTNSSNITVPKAVTRVNAGTRM